MKFPDVLTGLLQKKSEDTEYFFSLYFDTDAAAVATWSLDATGSPKVASFAHAIVAEDDWEARTQVIDRLLSAAEDKVGVTKGITKTVFGMPGAYLTPEGNITDIVRPQLKKLSHMLELTPVGFVPLSQAMAFSLKKEEGVPPSVILVGCSGKTAHVTLFRVGNMTHEDVFAIDEDPAMSLEGIFKRRQDGEVLPSRILLYGGNSAVLEEVRSKLLKHPWPTRTNFLHFPKIEIVTVEELLTAVSHAGASELSHEIGENTSGGDNDEEAATVVAQPPATTRETPAEQSMEAAIEEAEETIEEEDVVEDADEEDEEASDDVVADALPIGKSPAAHDEMPSDEELSNVEVVTPETLGFRREDVLEHVPLKAKEPAPTHSLPVKLMIPHISMPDVKVLRTLFSRIPKMKGKSLPILFGVVVVILIGILLYYTVPRVTVTVLVASQSVDESAAISVDPAATIADPSSKIIPGRTQEQSVTGEKTVAVTGKKNVGDPAKGTVTIYNKVTSSRTFPKGTVLTTNGVSFTLDSDVSVASASESIGSITFGKTTTNVTAKDIGPNGNVSASSEFAFANINSAQVSARNEAAFTGGTSKQVTVVSRVDQDNVVKALTDELVAKAKEQLLALAGGERLIDATIKTEVAEKVFDAELDEEAKELHGKITVKVSGISVADSDIKAALSSLVEAKVPAGYRLAPEQTAITTSNVTVKKDGSITLTAKLTAVALPLIDTDALRKTLVGRDVNSALGLLKETQGVGGAEFNFTLSPTKSRLPLNSNNITVTVMVQ